jgi:hypothetical protein
LLSSHTPAIAAQGVNRAGFSRINVTATVADGVESVIVMAHAETANSNGVVNAYCGGQAPCVVDDWSFNLANQTNQLTLRPGVEHHTFTPFSAYAGFRFVEVRWRNMPKGAEFSLESMHVHTRVKLLGHLHFENETLRKIQDAILRTQLNNLHSLPSDCPTRSGACQPACLPTPWCLCLSLCLVWQHTRMIVAAEMSFLYSYSHSQGKARLDGRCAGHRGRGEPQFRRA